MNAITPANAYRYSDAYTIETVAEPINVFGCEHNRQEAEALARWLESTKGIRVRVVWNNPDTVRAAQAIKPKPMRYQYREIALREMGVI